MGETHHINMRIALCITLALVAVYAAPSSELSDSEYKSLFAKFQTVHSASYLSEDHASSKFAVFKDNVVTGFKDVTANSESQLAAAVAQGPVSVAIEADQSGFQFYKSGVFSGTCGTALDHDVL